MASKLGVRLRSEQYEGVGRYVEVFSALAHKLRVHVYLKLLKEGELNIVEAFAPHRPKRSSMTHHLNTLEDAGLITRYKNGRDVILRVEKNRVEALVEILRDFL